MKKFAVIFAIAVAGLLQTSSTASAQNLTVTIESLQPTGGFFFTPVWNSLHDGNFDLFDVGQDVSGGTGLQVLAETGNTAVLSGEFAGSGIDQTIIGPDGDAAGPFDPGESASQTFNNVDTTTNRFFSFASMIIPSNDAFVGNGNPLAYEIFDANGDFIFGNGTIDVFASDIYDAGTEVNNINGGAAFSANGGDRADEGGSVQLIDLADLNDFVGTDTVAGPSITQALTPDSPVFRISFTNAVPEPGSMSVLALVGGAFFMRRRR